MTLRQLSTELERIERDLQSLRRADFEIAGDFTYAAALRQHLVSSLEEARQAVDCIIISLDHVDDADKLTTLRARITDRVRKALGTGDDQ